MKIEKIDKNFKKSELDFKSKIIDVPSKYVSLFGVSYNKDQGFIRMSLDEAQKVSENVKYLAQNTAGGRIAFSTNSNKIAINVTYDNLTRMGHMALTGQAGFSLLEVKNNKEYHRQTFALDYDNSNGYSCTSRELKGKGKRDYVLYFPLYNNVKSLTLEISENATISPFNPYFSLKPIVFYGHSITQGGCASRPDNSYQSFISKILHIDHINLGFSGNAKGEPCMAEYLGRMDCSIMVIDYDHNTPDVEHLKKTHENFYLTFRKYQPLTPVILMSATNYYEDEKLYNQRREVIKETFKKAVLNGDKNIYFVDGAKFYPANVREFCTVDGAHPNDLGFYFISKKLIKLIKSVLKLK